MQKEINIEISGIGIIFHSPFAVSHIKKGDDYLESSFINPEDVAKHVNDCTIAAFGTGSPGHFIIQIFDGEYPQKEILSSMSAIRLGVEVKDCLLIFRDLYELMEWDPTFSNSRAIRLENGFYKISAYTFLPESGVLGDNQLIKMHFEQIQEKPDLNWQGVPDLAKQ